MLCTHKTASSASLVLEICPPFNNSYLNQFSSIFGGNCIKNVLTDDLDSTTPLISHRKYMSTINVDLYSPPCRSCLLSAFSLALRITLRSCSKTSKATAPFAGFHRGCPSPFHSTNKRGRVKSVVNSLSFLQCGDRQDGAASFTHDTHSPFLHPAHRIHMDQLNNALFRSSRAQQELKRH